MDAWRRPGAQLWKDRVDLVGRINDVCVRLFENDQQHRALVVEQTGLVAIFLRIDRRADVAQWHGRAVMLRHDDRLILIGLSELIVARDDKSLVLAIKRALW